MTARHGSARKVPAGAELVIMRTFDAPREAVWNAWTDPAQFMRWWGPEGFTCPECSIEFRVGGRYLYCMRSPEGRDYWGTGVYRDIQPMERILCTDCFADEKGNVVPASHYGMQGEWPLEMTVTVLLEDTGGKTGLTLLHDGIPPETKKDCEAGWNGSFEKLARIL